jgi:hypothetical protein
VRHHCVSDRREQAGDVSAGAGAENDTAQPRSGLLTVGPQHVHYGGGRHPVFAARGIFEHERAIFAVAREVQYVRTNREDIPKVGDIGSRAAVDLQVIMFGRGQHLPQFPVGRTRSQPAGLEPTRRISRTGAADPKTRLSGNRARAASSRRIRPDRTRPASIAAPISSQNSMDVSPAEAGICSGGKPDDLRTDRAADPGGRVRASSLSSFELRPSAIPEPSPIAPGQPS